MVLNVCNILGLSELEMKNAYFQVLAWRIETLYKTSKGYNDYYNNIAFCWQYLISEHNQNDIAWIKIWYSFL